MSFKQSFSSYVRHYVPTGAEPASQLCSVIFDNCMLSFTKVSIITFVYCLAANIIVNVPQQVKDFEKILSDLTDRKSKTDTFSPVQKD